MVTNPPSMRETWVQSLGWEDPLEKGMQPTPVFLPRESPWTEEPGGLQSMGSQRVGHDWLTKHIAHILTDPFCFMSETVDFGLREQMSFIYSCKCWNRWPVSTGQVVYWVRLFPWKPEWGLLEWRRLSIIAVLGGGWLEANGKWKLLICSLLCEKSVFIICN